MWLVSYTDKPVVCFGVELLFESIAPFVVWKYESLITANCEVHITRTCWSLLATCFVSRVVRRVYDFMNKNSVVRVPNRNLCICLV